MELVYETTFLEEPSLSVLRVTAVGWNVDARNATFDGQRVVVEHGYVVADGHLPTVATTDVGHVDVDAPTIYEVDIGFTHRFQQTP